MTTPLTAERLRHHLFSRSAYPHWRYRRDELLFGVEVEYHVAQKGNRNRLFRKADFEALLRLLHRYGYAKYETADHHWKVSKDTELGYIMVKPDFAFHILEITLPPRSDLVVLADMLKNVLQEVDSCLDKLGFERLRDSFLDLNISEMELVKIPRYEDYLNYSREHSGQNRFSELYFPAFMVATHVHLNVSSEETLRLMPILYELEWMALTLFDRTHHPGRTHDISLIFQYFSRSTMRVRKGNYYNRNVLCGKYYLCLPLNST